MIYLMINGRFGNHLFQYAFARTIASKTGDTIAIDWSRVNERHSKDGDGWINSFQDFNVCNLSECSIEQIMSPMQKKLINLNRKFTYHRYLKRLLPLVKLLSQYWGVYVSLDGKYFPYSYFGSKNKILLGYFECDKYFRTIEGILKKEITPKCRATNKNVKLWKRIQETESICVTVRRGDFFTKANVKNLGACCNVDYFQRGIKYIKKQYPNSVIFFFSDEIEWVKQNIKMDGEIYFESGNDPLWEKLRLMSGCKHFVISNSTFSWWAQYLSDNKSKIVVAPKHWRENDDSYDIKQDNWILL